MTVRRPRLLRTQPGYQSDFEDAVGPAFKSLIIVAVWADGHQRRLPKVCWLSLAHRF
jgi:hypothetical protein